MPVLSTLGGASAFGFAMNRLAAAIGAETDQYWANTVLLINGDGAADGGQNNTFLDTSGNGHAITRNGNVTQGSFSPFAKADGKWGNYFDGSGDYLTVPNNTDLILGTGDCTIECWVYPLAVNASNANPILNKLNGASNNGWLLGMSNTGLWQFSTGSNVIVRAGTVVLNTWTHLAAVRESGTTTLYVNGVSVGTTASVFDFTDTVDLFVGFNSSFVAVNAYVSNARIIKGTAVYTSDFTPPTSPLTAVTGTSLLTCQSNRFVDNSTNAHAITVNGTPKVVTFSPFPETEAYTRSTINQGAMEFDGTGDKLTTSGASIGDFGTGDFTIEAWINPDALSGYNSIIADDTYSSGSTPNAWCFYLDGTSLDGWKGGSSILTGGTLTVGQWHHVAWTRSSGTMYLFLDGQQVATASDSTSFNHGDIIVASNVGNYYLDGHLSNVRIVKGTAVYTSDFTVPTEPLTAITNTSLLTCQAAGAVDNSSNAHTITVNGDAKQSVFVPFGERSVEFDGTGDYLVADNASLAVGTGDFTYECWVYSDSPADDSIFETRASGASSDTTGFTLTFFSSSVIRVWYNGSSRIASSGSYASKWTHVAVVKESGTTTLYINGISAGTTTALNNLTNDDIIIGQGRYTGSTSIGLGDFNGHISNFRLVKGTAVYTANFTPPTEPLTAVTGTSLLTCQNSVFQDNSGNAHAITVNGDPQASNNLPFGERSWYFDDASSYNITAGLSSLNFSGSDFTIEAFIHLNSDTNSVIARRGRYAAGDSEYSFEYESGGSLLLELTTDGTSTGRTIFTTTNTMSVGQWHHVAACYDTTANKVYLAIDGVVEETSYSSTTHSDTGVVGIGATNNGGDNFDGYISNLRMVKGDALYTSDFEAPTSSLTNTANTTLLVFQNSILVDASDEKHTLVVYDGNAEASTNIPFAPTTTYGVQQYLDDAYTVANRGGSSYYDGSGDYLTIPSSTDFSMGTGDFTIEGWVWWNGQQNKGVFHIDTSHLSTNIGGIAVGSNLSPYDWRVYYDSTGANTGAVTVPYQWNHFAYVRSSGVTKLYVNGIEEFSVSDTTNYTQSYLFIGGYYNTSYLLDGYISDFRLVKGTALYQGNFTPPPAPLNPVSGTELLCNFTNASIIDRTGSNVIETVGNAQVDTTTFKYGTGALEFDGSGDYLIPNGSPESFTFGTGDFTVEMWVRTTNLTNNNILYDSRPSSTNGNYITWYIGTDGSLNYYVNSALRISSSASAISTDTWYHIAVSRTGTSTKMFIDGTQVGSTYTDSTNYLNGSNRPTIAISGGFLDNPLNGYIDDLRVTKGIARYTANFTAPTKELPSVGQ